MSKLTSNKKNVALMILTSCFTFSLVLGVSISKDVFFAHAESDAILEALSENGAFKTTGASIRICNEDDTTNGINFGVLMSKDAYNNLFVEGVMKEDVSTGVLVLPSDLAGEELTVNSNSVKNEQTSNHWREFNEDYMISSAYLYGIPETSYNRDISFRGYVVSNGVYYYTDVCKRSIAYVANATMNDETVSSEVKESVSRYLLDYVIHYNANDAVVKTSTIKYGQKDNLNFENPVPENEEYEFAGWWNSDFTEEWTSESTVVGNTELYAKWVVNEKYLVSNGGFEIGNLDGWTLNGELGNVSSANKYWVNENGGYSFNKVGDYFFSAYEPDDRYEGNKGTLVSSKFTLGGSGFVTFRLGAGQHDVFVDVMDAETNTAVASFVNTLWSETTDGVKSGCTMNAYKADLSDYLGKELYFSVRDNATRYYGIFFVDDFVSYYEEEPSGFALAENVLYTVVNGGFELGNTNGWVKDGEDFAVVSNADVYWNHNGGAGVAYGKEGNYLLTWWTLNEDGSEHNREGARGTLTSSSFILKPNAWVSFKLGGGVNNTNIRVEFINADTGVVEGKFYNTNAEEGRLIAYKYQFNNSNMMNCYIRIVDETTGGWGCLSADDFKVNLNEEPSGILAGNYLNLINGSFESGLYGWVREGDEFAVVSNDTKYWGANYGDKDGNNLFSWWTDSDNVSREGAKGTLTSASFVLEANSIVSFRFGGGRGNNEIRIEFVNADTNEIIGKFYNTDGVDGILKAYTYQFNNSSAINCYIRIVDNAESGWGCLAVDDFRINLNEKPTDFTTSINQINQEQ